jgi:hypothetical protein
VALTVEGDKKALKLDSVLFSAIVELKNYLIFNSSLTSSEAAVIVHLCDVTNHCDVISHCLLW